ncbi:hypothetical protein COLO4_32946 [Corchorus olitorius]|uniref:Uncharacterized protein n=1 Tax=Corchorus olitorius TaxID=93759 RepID=A0A1R3GX69_9ROSI|nr:hypothetical protein COLO4_32946 [Corchorus olitorius]
MECQKHANEVFCTGNAVGVLPVGSITYKDKRVRLMGVATPPYSPACTITMALTTGYPFVLVLTFNHHKNFKNFFGVWTITNFYRMLNTFEASTPWCKIDGFAWTQFLLDGFFKVLVALAWTERDMSKLVGDNQPISHSHFKIWYIRSFRLEMIDSGHHINKFQF